MPQLDPTWFSTQLFWLAITFIILYFVIWRSAVPRIAEIKSTRSQKIESDLEKAEGLRAKAAEVQEAYEQALAKAAEEARAVHREAAREIAERNEQQHAKLNEQLMKRAAEANAEIAKTKDAAVAEMRDASVDVVRSVAKRLVGAEVDAAAAKKALEAAEQEVR